MLPGAGRCAQPLPFLEDSDVNQCENCGIFFEGGESDAQCFQFCSRDCELHLEERAATMADEIRRYWLGLMVDLGGEA